MKNLSIITFSAVVILSAGCQQESKVATTATPQSSATAASAAPAPSATLPAAPATTPAEVTPTATAVATATPSPAGSKPALVAVPDSATKLPAKSPAAAVAASAHDHHSMPTTASGAKYAVSKVAGILEPSNFSDPAARDAYAKAQEIPDRLEKMYCYCHCRDNPGLKHKSLLTCFQSDHAAECGICMQEAVMAWQDMKDGIPVEGTQKAADLMYNNGNPPAGHVH